jgi:hypothetical protein
MGNNMFYKCYHMKNIFTFAVLCKAMTGLKRKCQGDSGQSKKIRKVFSGQVITNGIGYASGAETAQTDSSLGQG